MQRTVFFQSIFGPNSELLKKILEPPVNTIYSWNGKKSKEKKENVPHTSVYKDCMSQPNEEIFFHFKIRPTFLGFYRRHLKVSIFLCIFLIVGERKQRRMGSNMKFNWKRNEHLNNFYNFVLRFVFRKWFVSFFMNFICWRINLNKQNTRKTIRLTFLWFYLPKFNNLLFVFMTYAYRNCRKNELAYLSNEISGWWCFVWFFCRADGIGVKRKTSLCFTLLTGEAIKWWHTE